ncbi:hypothetical protein EHQ53_07615 [Leptospira langatensis]|uniref:YIP1 family protein n=1 Tax=Leptospira langatensis TaxID=2484983 RepID=A0A5F1ZU33_9LEPT|nr:hypothetical protein [Leptospira langatensis]TGK01491.1 hypothetical protein EHO57_11255 [Leptospira langatensis]TGL42059.1 hypothetical protein EHQ53_07615 [Leptospira langatensis]
MILINSQNPLTETEKSKLSLLEKIFKAPQEAFDLYLRDSLLGRKELLRLHYALWALAPISKISGNVLKIILDWLFSDEVEFSLFSGVFTSILLYPVVLLVVSQLDVLRVFYKKVDRVKGESYPPADVLTVAFLPFSASAIFWILPGPLNLGLIGISFLYSIYLCFVGMKRVSGVDSKETLLFFLVGMAYLLSISLVFTFVYNIIRTILN